MCIRDRITSDDKGHAVSIAIPYGTYVVVESKTPHNMKTIKPFEVKISENHPDTVSYTHLSSSTAGRWQMLIPS